MKTTRNIATVKTALLTVLAILSAVYGYYLTDGLEGPLTGTGDTAAWEYTGYFLKTHLSFIPWPHLDLKVTDVFFPYGISAVFQSWGIERDLFFSLFYTLFGHGPWLKLYFILSLVITAAGMFLILQREVGSPRAFIAAFATVFFNFYLFFKFPGHLNMTLIHWVVLSITTDHILVRRFVLKQRIGLKMILFRILLLVLSMGLELGYVAGCSILSLVISMTFAAVVYGWRHFRKHAVPEERNSFFKTVTDETVRAPGIIALLIFSIFIFTFLYIPLVFQIALETLNFPQVPEGGYMWSSPLRLIVPWFPEFNPLTVSGGIADILEFNDFPEGRGAGSPGWFLLLFALSGFLTAKKRIVYIPVLVMAGLVIFYKPHHVPTLSVFPWFAYARTGSRFILIMPVLLSLIGTGFHLKSIKAEKIKAVVCVLLFLTAALEAATFLSTYSYQSKPLSESSRAFFKTVAAAEGKAVLDWPFCIAGGNRIGTGLLGRYYHLNNHVYAYQRFHGKKVMGQYLGRLHPRQLDSYLLAGWDKLFMPDHPSPFKAKRQKKSFSPEQWAFFTSFFTLNDFCGINLYTDLLAEGDEQNFYRIFGRPAAETFLPRVGKVVFIPKHTNLEAKENPEKGKEIAFLPYYNGKPAPLLGRDIPAGINVAGLGAPVSTKIGKCKSACANTRIVFKTKSRMPLILIFKGLPAYASEKVDMHLLINNHPVALPPDEVLRIKAPFVSRKGINTIVFSSEGISPRKTLLNFRSLGLERRK